ncbi:MAG TPA: hypothetical protein VGD67_26150 [Pseudonocardiaceae bacterium]
MLATMDRVWAGVDRLLDDYARVAPGDVVVVAYTPESREPAAWVVTTLHTRGVDTRPLLMRPFDDPGLAARLEPLLPTPAELDAPPGRRLVVITTERDTMSHTGVLRDALARYRPEQWLSARIISASAEFFTHAMNAPAAELSRVNAALLTRMMGARRLHVTTAGGTDLTIELDGDRYRWLSNRGAHRPGGFMILPPGEVATYASSVDGVFVADGAFNVNVFTRLDPRLAAHPPRIELRGGVAVDFSCPDPSVRELLRLCFERPNVRRVGEVGFGTNAAIPDYVPLNSHINERRPGLHLGFGQHNQSITVVEYESDVHLDLIADGALVRVDDEDEPIDLAHVAPTDAPHPLMVLDEDIDGDCCGLWLEDLRAGRCVPRAVPPPEPGGDRGPAAGRAGPARTGSAGGGPA